LNADAFIMLTDVLAVAMDFGKPEQRQIRHATPTMLRAIEFDQATMGPKIEAGCGFVDATGKWAAIGALSDVTRILCGEAGTRIVGSLPGKMDFWDS
jgi:carbamate kinase